MTLDAVLREHDLAARRIADDRFAAEDTSDGLCAVAQEAHDRIDLRVAESPKRGHDPAGTPEAHGLAQIIIRHMRQFARGEWQANAALPFHLQIPGERKPHEAS